MKRLGLAVLMTLGWLVLLGAGVVGAPSGPGWPPQTQLFNDAHFLATAVPFLMALGVGVGLFQARAAARGGGDALLGQAVRRHDTATVLAHWINAFGLIGCLVTGAMILRWTSRPLELRLTFAIHFVGAGGMLFAICNHLARHLVSGGTGLIPKSLGVVRDLIGELLEYAGLFGPEAAALRWPWPKAIRQPIARYVRALLGYKPGEHGKYLATEQILSYPPWAILMTIVVVTGLIKVMKYLYPLPGTWVAAATAVHDIAALGVGVMLIIHLLPLLLVPANWPLLLSMFRTTVPRKYVEQRHPAWYRQLLSRPAAGAADSPAGAADPAAGQPNPPAAQAQTGD